MKRSADKKSAKAAYDRERRARLKDEIAAAKRAYYLANKDRENARVATWCEQNKARSLEIKNAWKARNPDAENTPACRERRATYMRTYRQERPEIAQANQRVRRAKVSKATPLWADKEAIKAFYVEARAKGMHVDHVVPLHGRDVCGLHVQNNLQLLPPPENRRKGNRYAG